MSCIKVLGGKPLYGSVRVQGSKNAALPIIAAAILNKGTSMLHNCPRITDVFYMIQILEYIGCRTSWQGNTLIINAENVNKHEIPDCYAKEMRSSVILLGSILGRCREAKIPYPGGCVIGARPIDMHLSALEEMGVRIWEKDDILRADAQHMAGTDIQLSFPSVGATENVLLAAVLSEGMTTIRNCAKEPEITELCQFLIEMGARIEGKGTDTIVVYGVKELHDVEYRIPADRIVAGTYMLAAAAAKGKVELVDAPVEQLDALLGILEAMQVKCREDGDHLVVDATERCSGVKLVNTEPYPGFPTDLQSQLMAALCVCEGTSCIRENIFEARYKVAADLIKMGADIRIHNEEAVITGVPKLTGCEVEAQELRGGASLLIAGLCAEGVTTIENRKFIDRGYEDIVRDLNALGVEIA